MCSLELANHQFMAAERGRTMRITCLFHRINFGFMTPGPPPRRPVRGRASRSDVAGQSKLCTARTDAPRGACVPPSRPPKHAEAQSAGGTVVRQGGGGRHPRMVTSRDGVPRLPGRGRARHAGAGHAQQEYRMASAGSVRSNRNRGPRLPGPGVRCLCVVFHWQVGLGSRGPE